jgi:hypothetical protein
MLELLKDDNSYDHSKKNDNEIMVYMVIFLDAKKDVDGGERRERGGFSRPLGCVFDEFLRGPLQLCAPNISG